MQIRRVKIIILGCIILLLAGCATGNPAPIVGSPPGRTVDRQAQAASTENELDLAEPEPIPFAVLYRREQIGRAMYEPAEGVYLGAWLRPDTPIRTFENQTGRRHAVYVHEMQLGDEIPINWLLQCMASLTTPLFIVHAPSPQTGLIVGHFDDDDYNYNDEISMDSQIVSLAQRLGAFNLPMFVAFFPPGHNMPAEEYTLWFRYARAVFLAYAPLTAFVWVAPGLASTPDSPFYPGHDSVDWVGVSLLAGRDAEGLTHDILQSFEPFYMAFNQHMPIMLLPLGISHRSHATFEYNLECASDEISRVYNALGTSFPRVGLVAYGDAFIIGPDAYNDFSITLEHELIEAYKNAIEPGSFLSALDKDATGSFARRVRWARSAFHGYYYDGTIYLDVNTLSRELAASVPRATTEINGSQFAEAGRITGRDVTHCEQRRVIFVE